MERRTTKNLGRSSTAGYCSQTGQEIPKNRVINLKKSRKHAEFADLDGPSW
jgi:RNA polymerase-binding transcription factor DksA